MANWIIGTAGHVDHGKTALVKALTGIDTDRLQEEKERGMSIELGFASLPLSSHQSASIIDVPGHEKFIKNMLAGASGIDLALMVIAADDGVMPQTIEHLEIMQLLGLQRGVIALTKIDLVDQEWLELVTEEIREKMNGSFLAEAPILQISSVTGQGISELKQVIESELSSIQTKHEEGPFRLPIDRIFTITGIGTVVTGTLISGTIHLGDPVEVMPKKLKSRARHLQSHGHKVESIHAGMRTAVNLAGLDVEEIERGDVVTSDQALTPTSMIDARFYLLPDASKAIENRTRIRFHLGTAEILGRIILLDKDALNPGEEAFVQIRLESPTVAVRGDRFVVRSYSPQHTIGGGTIIASNPPKHHRFSTKTQAYLEAAEKGDLAKNFERIIREAEYGGISLERTFEKAGLNKNSGSTILKDLIQQSRIRLVDDSLFHPESIESLHQKLIARLASYHTAKPASIGLSREELRKELAPKCSANHFNQLIDDAIHQGILSSIRNKLKLPSHQIQMDPRQQLEYERIEKAYKQAHYAPPEKDQVVLSSNKLAQEMFDLLVDLEILIRIEEFYFHRDAIQGAKETLKKAIQTNGKITVAEFRDLTGSTRKYMLPLLNYFDANHLTRRVGDDRFLV